MNRRSSKVTISDDQNSVYIYVGTTIELKMNINMKMHNNNYFITQVDLYYRDNRIDLAKIDEKWISLLIVEYSNLINNLNKSIDHKPKKQETSNYRQIISVIKNMTSIRRTVEIFLVMHMY